MSTTMVAQYSYDKSGRLRAEWDPRISPALKTTYGYDVEGRVTSLLPPGEQPWLLVYGTGPGDIRTGHLLSATRPAPTTEAGTGVTPQNTAPPALSSTNAPEGKTLTVTTGTWNNTPLAYGYQWEECQAISGAESCSLLDWRHKRKLPLRISRREPLAEGAGHRDQREWRDHGRLGFHRHRGREFQYEPRRRNSGRKAAAMAS